MGSPSHVSPATPGPWCQGDHVALETLAAFDLTVADVRRPVGGADRRAG